MKILKTNEIEIGTPLLNDWLSLGLFKILFSMQNECLKCYNSMLCMIINLGGQRNMFSSPNEIAQPK